MELEKRKQYKQFATWLNNNEYLTQRVQLIPYELAEMYLESDYYKQLCEWEGSDENSGLHIADVTNRTLKDSRKQAYLQGYRKRAIMSELTYDHTSEMNAIKEFDNWHLNLYGW